MLITATTFILLFQSCFAICPFNPSFYRFRFGDVKGIILSDGPQVVGDSPFLVPDKLVFRSYRACFRRTSPSIFGQNVVLLDTKAGRLLIDTGSFNQDVELFPFLRRGGRLQENLAAAGVEPDSIDAVLLTHGHLDHVGGLLTLNGSASFPNAKLYVGEAEHKFWSTTAPPGAGGNLPDNFVVLFSEIYRRSVAPYADRLNLVSDGGTPLPGIKYVLGPGHSPGHSAIEVTTGTRRLVLTGDTWISKPDQLQHPEWGHGFESSAEDAVTSRRRILRRVANRKDLVIAYHEDFPGLGHVVKHEKAFDWVPMRSQLLGIGVSVEC